MKPIRLLVVDDSPIICSKIEQYVKGHADIDLLGFASNPYEARDQIVHLKPDVITLDIHMPRMDGLTFLQRLMHYYPMRVVVLSSLSQEGSETALKAIELGAIEVLGKPSAGQWDYEFEVRLIHTIKAASIAKLETNQSTSKIKILSKIETKRTLDVIAIGASTGGVQALHKLLVEFGKDTPGILVVQHIPPKFSMLFANRLNEKCVLDVKEAEGGDVLSSGKILIAPGDKHMVLKRSNQSYCVETKSGPFVSHHRPSVDVLFNSVAETAKNKAVGIIMTGMGNDGARGLKNMKDQGALTIAQDEESCVIFGMPKQAILNNGVDLVVPLNEIAKTVKNICQESK